MFVTLLLLNDWTDLDKIKVCVYISIWFENIIRPGGGIAIDLYCNRSIIRNHVFHVYSDAVFGSRQSLSGQLVYLYIIVNEIVNKIILSLEK